MNADPFVSEEPESGMFQSIVDVEKEFDFTYLSFTCKFVHAIKYSLA